MVDDQVLTERDGVGGHPVDEEAGGEAEQEEAEGDGEDAHEVLLLGGGLADGQLL